MKATHKKVNRGPGGIKCPCCRLGSLKASRVMLNRLNRRAGKMAIANE